MKSLLTTLLFSLFICSNISSQCLISDLIVEAHECDNGTFLVDIDFNHVGTSDSFQVAGNGNNYGTFAYSDLFLTLGPFEGNGTTEYEFVIIDSDHADCTKGFDLGKINCEDGNECKLTSLEVEFDGCNDNGTYLLHVNFDHQNANNPFFDLFANGTFFGFYEFSDLPLTIPNFPSSGNDHDVIKICVNDHPDCCTILEFESPNCNDECGLTNFIAEAYDCDNDGTFLIDIDFDATGSSDSFQLVGNGNHYGNFAYEDLYLTLGPFAGDGITEYEFIAIDMDNPGCTNFVELEAIECVMTDIDDFITTQIQLYPNPTKDFIFIKNETSELLEKVIVSNSIGQQIKNLNISQTEIDISELEEGVYFLQIKIGENWLTKKIVVHK